LNIDNAPSKIPLILVISRQGCGTALFAVVTAAEEDTIRFR